jgi:hypothetical protein
MNGIFKGGLWGGLRMAGFVKLIPILLSGSVLGGGAVEDTVFKTEVEPVLVEFCYDCHGDGSSKGEVAFDRFESFEALKEDRKLWLHVMKLLRSDIMPPVKKSQPEDEQKERIGDWIKTAVFGIDPLRVDPGKVTVRRLNRIEYRNTIRDLLGVDYDTLKSFPADDTGHGFDNIADVLTVSPMLLEKYFDAAQAIIAEAVPVSPLVPPVFEVPGGHFLNQEAKGELQDGPLNLSYYENSTVVARPQILASGDYQVELDLRAIERYVDNQFDYNKCRLTFSIDGEQVLEREFVREGAKPFLFSFQANWAPGEHVLELSIAPLTPDDEQIRSLRIQLNKVVVRGPLDEGHWVRPSGYERFFGDGVPIAETQRLDLAREILEAFTERAFRRPVDRYTIDRLVSISRGVFEGGEGTFEYGIAQAMVAVLASPRFIFREEVPLKAVDREHPLIDEYSLASRLSYFIWASSPDHELMALAKGNQLRANLKAQMKRMLDDKRSEAFVRHFAGQWLQARDIETVSINERAVLAREEKPDPELENARKVFRELRRIPEEKRTEEEQEKLDAARQVFFRSFRRPRAQLSSDLRRSMRIETERVFDYVIRNDRPLHELIDANYTFLDSRLAAHYAIEGVEGEAFRKVDLPVEHPRGGILTQGTLLAVTSNPTRTSPVKRGLFILENLLGTPPAPPPPDIPALEDVAKQSELAKMTLRETLQLHREQPLCRSCHDRMDPLGLALENFNAMGMWRENEREQVIDAGGVLVTGEAFSSVQELKRILAHERRLDFYRCFVEKFLTFALGRGLDYSDIHTQDILLDRLVEAEGKPSVLLSGIIESVPFQRTRNQRVWESPDSETVFHVPNDGAIE